MRSYIDLLSNEYDAMADKIKQLPAGNARANLTEMHVKGQQKLVQALIMQDQESELQTIGMKIDKVIDEAEDRLNALKSLVKHHITKELWNDENT